MVPDISFSASADHDGYLVCTQNFTSTTNPADTTGSTCVDGFRISSGGNLTSYGGTSASVQGFSGLMTLLVQANGRQGNINTKLYSLAANATTYAEVFHDITSGNSIVPCSFGTTGCVGGEVGYPATTGYDMATGLGSINGCALNNAVEGLTSGVAVSALTPWRATVSASPTSLPFGSAVTLTAMVCPGNASGQVTFAIGGTSLGSAPISGGVATLTVTASAANGFSSGSNTITGSYSGASTIASGTATVSVNSTYTVAIAASGSTSITLADGGSQQLGLTLQSSGYAGTVTFTTSVTLNGAATSAVTASAAPVVLASNGTGSTALTITATANAANHAPARPWKSGGALVLAALLGAPLTLRRRRALAVLLTLLAISAAGFMMACGGGGSSSTPTPTARTYYVTVTPTGTGTVVNATALTITVTIQ
jgi:hypothetical protein